MTLRSPSSFAVIPAKAGIQPLYYRSSALALIDQKEVCTNNFSFVKHDLDESLKSYPETQNNPGALLI
jgi:hypothetical protein